MNLKPDKLQDSAPAILEASTEAIATIDINGRIQGYNNRFLLLLGIREDEVHSLQIKDLFTNLDWDAKSYSGNSDFEAAELTLPDHSKSWVLIKILMIGKLESGYKTLLIHDPESVRRIVDRLDYIENYDMQTSLLNSRKGILEFEQLQISNLSGGCYLLAIDTDEKNEKLDDYLRKIARHFNRISEQSVICRYSNCELLFVYTCDEPLSVDTHSMLIDALANDPDIANLAIRLSFMNWLAGTLSVNAILDRLKVDLTAISDHHLLTSLSSSKRQSSQASFIDTLNKALEQGEMEFFIQPQISSDTRQVISGELLIRWIPPSGNIIPPSQFINFLEEGEFAYRFFKWSVERTVSLLKYLYEQIGKLVKGIDQYTMLIVNGYHVGGKTLFPFNCTGKAMNILAFQYFDWHIHPFAVFGIIFDEGDECFQRHGPSGQITLKILATNISQESGLVGFFDTFGNDFQAKHMSQ